MRASSRQRKGAFRRSSLRGAGRRYESRVVSVSLAGAEVATALVLRCCEPGVSLQVPRGGHHLKCKGEGMENKGVLEADVEPRGVLQIPLEGLDGMGSDLSTGHLRGPLIGSRLRF